MSLGGYGTVYVGATAGSGGAAWLAPPPLFGGMAVADSIEGDLCHPCGKGAEGRVRGAGLDEYPYGALAGLLTGVVSAGSLTSTAAAAKGVP